MKAHWLLHMVACVLLNFKHWHEDCNKEVHTACVLTVSCARVPSFICKTALNWRKAELAESREAPQLEEMVTHKCLILHTVCKRKLKNGKNVLHMVSSCWGFLNHFISLKTSAHVHISHNFKMQKFGHYPERQWSLRKDLNHHYFNHTAPTSWQPQTKWFLSVYFPLAAV